MDVEHVNNDAMDLDPAPEQDAPKPSEQPNKGAITRTRRRQQYNPYEFDNRFVGSAFLATADTEPVSYRQALNSVDSFRWKEAIFTLDGGT